MACVNGLGSDHLIFWGGCKCFSEEKNWVSFLVKNIWVSVGTKMIFYICIPYCVCVCVCVCIKECDINVIQAVLLTFVSTCPNAHLDRFRLVGIAKCIEFEQNPLAQIKIY